MQSCSSATHMKVRRQGEHHKFLVDVGEGHGARGTSAALPRQHAGAKAGVESRFYLATGRSLGPFGIRVQRGHARFYPDPTRRARGWRSQELSATEQVAMIASVPLSRPGRPRGGAACGCCLPASTAASYVSGSIIQVNGGRYKSHSAESEARCCSSNHSDQRALALRSAPPWCCWYSSTTDGLAP